MKTKKKSKWNLNIPTFCWCNYACLKIHSSKNNIWLCLYCDRLLKTITRLNYEVPGISFSGIPNKQIQNEYDQKDYYINLVSRKGKIYWIRNCKENEGSTKSHWLLASGKIILYSNQRESIKRLCSNAFLSPSKHLKTPVKL